MSHDPSGAFWPTIDSFGRVIFTRWDHLERDVTADADSESTTGTIHGTFNFSDETIGAQIIPRMDEIFPEPSPVRKSLWQGTNQNPMEFNQFFPWMINEDGTGEETLNHIGPPRVAFRARAGVQRRSQSRRFQCAEQPALQSEFHQQHAADPRRPGASRHLFLASMRTNSARMQPDKFIRSTDRPACPPTR